MKSFTRSFIPFLFAIALASLSQAAPLPRVTPEEAGYSSERIEILHDVLEGFVDRGEYAGYVSLIARDGAIVDWRAYGVQDVESGRPMRKDSIMRMYSMSKIVTSVAILMLMDEGKLRLNDPVGKFLPELANAKVYVSGEGDSMELVDPRTPVTIKHLLTHTSGYYYHWGPAPKPLLDFINELHMEDATTLAEFMESVAKVSLAESPGKTYRYSISTDILGAVVEAASGMPFEQFLEERLFKPLGMVDTSFSVPESKCDRLALIHVRKEGKLVVDPGLGFNFPSGGAGLYSTAEDFARFAIMLQQGGELNGVRYLSPKTIQLMTKNHLSTLEVPHLPDTPGVGFGLGVRVILDRSKRTSPETEGAYGWDGAATTTSMIDPVEGTVTILLTQNMQFNAGRIFDYWTNLHYGALIESRE